MPNEGHVPLILPTDSHAQLPLLNGRGGHELMIQNPSLPAPQLQTSHLLTHSPPPTATHAHATHTSSPHRPVHPLTTNATFSLTHSSTCPNPYACTTHSSASTPPTLTQTILDSTLLHPTQPRLHQQLISYPEGTNEFWGDTVDMNPPLHILRVLSHNVNTINSAENLIKWQAAAQALHEYSVGITCLQETNTQWSHPILH